MSKILVTSDLHFGHDNIIKYCNRPFRNAEEMGEYIVAEWNRRVTDEDTVYILGDVAMGPKSSDPAYVTRYLSRLRGLKRIVMGNHDLPVPKFKNIGLRAALELIPVENVEVLPGMTFNVVEDGVQFFMSHFPEVEGPVGSVLLHGHTHTELKDVKIVENARNKKFDIGIDSYGGPVLLTRDLRFLMEPKGWNV